MYRFRQCSMHISGQFIFDSYKPDSKISCKQHNRRIQDISKFLTADCNSTSGCFLYDRYTFPSESRAYTRSTNNHRIIPECRTMEIRVRLTLYQTSAKTRKWFASRQHNTVTSSYDYQRIAFRLCNEGNTAYGLTSLPPPVTRHDL